MDKLIKLSAVLAVFLLLGLVLWSFQDDRCLNSSVIRKVNILGSELYACEVSKTHSKFNWDPEFAKIFSQIEKDIRDFEVFKEQLNNSTKPEQTISIVVEKPFIYSIEDKKITMGQDLFDTDGYFKRALVQSWLNQILPKQTKENKILFEILTDNFMSLVWGDLNIKDPLLNKKINLVKQTNWLSDIWGEQFLCDSPWRPIERLNLCEDWRENAFNNSEVKYLNELSLWTLRPLVVKEFWAHYKKLNPLERISFIQSWFEYVTHLESGFEKFPTQIDLESLPTVANYTIKKLYNDSVESLELNLDLFVEIEKQKFEANEYFDLVKLAKDNPKLNILIRADDGLILLPSLQKIPVGYFHPQAKKQILVTCNKPTLAKIMNHKPENGRLLFIEKCGPKEMHLASYVNSTMEELAEKNPESNYMLFHIPSLKIATNHLNLNTKNSIEHLKQISLKSDLFGWKQNALKGTHKIQAALPIVEWVHWKE